MASLSALHTAAMPMWETLVSDVFRIGIIPPPCSCFLRAITRTREQMAGPIGPLSHRLVKERPRVEIGEHYLSTNRTLAAIDGLRNARWHPYAWLCDARRMEASSLESLYRDRNVKAVARYSVNAAFQRGRAKGLVTASAPPNAWAPRNWFANACNRRTPAAVSLTKPKPPAAYTASGAWRWRCL